MIFERKKFRKKELKMKTVTVPVIRTKKDYEAAMNGLKETKHIISSGDYQMVILDEANIATYYNLFSVDALIITVTNEITDTGQMALCAYRY